jgi:hypothetical protein
MKKNLKVHSVEMLVRRLDTTKNNDPAASGLATFSASGLATISASGLATISASGLAIVSASGLASI